MANIVYPNADGSVILYDGSTTFILDLEFSTNGLTYWESKYNSESHLYEEDGVTLLGPHKYLRFKKSGSVVWEQAAKFIGDNGDNPEFQIEDDILQWKLSLEDDWIDLLDITTLKGETGDKGEMGQGWSIDDAGALDIRPTCGSGAITGGSCNSCNPNSSGSTLSTYLSIGNHRICETDWNGTYYHTLDNVTWTATTSANEGLYVLAWQASDGTGTDALTTNSQGYIVALASLVSPYDSTGRVYLCADNLWTEVMDITTPTGLVKVSTNDSLTFIESKVDDVTIEAYDSNSDTFLDKVQVKDDGINENKIISTAIGDGLDGGSGTIITADPTDFIGFGLREYTSDADGEEDVQVFVDDFIGDGLISYDDVINQADGEDRNLARVNVDDIISPTTAVLTGLETSTDAGITETDGFDNIYVKPGDCIEIDPNGVNVKADELTILADGLVEEKVAETDSNTLGIQAKHLHANTVNTNKGLQKDGLTTGSLEVKPDTTRGSIGFNGTGEAHVPDNGIQGLHLNDNTCDNTKGVEISNDTITVKVDDTTIQFNVSGELEIIESYLQGLIDAGVATLVVPGEASMVGDIIFNASNNNSLISLAVAGSGATDGTVTFTTDVDESALTTFVTNIVNSIVTDATTYARLKDILVAGSGITITPNDSLNTLTIASTATVPIAGSTESLDGSLADGVDTTYARSDHKHSIDDGALTIPKTSGLQGELDSKIELNTAYGNGQMATSGLLIQSPNGSWFQLQVNDNGDLDTRKV